MIQITNCQVSQPKRKILGIFKIITAYVLLGLFTASCTNKAPITAIPVETVEGKYWLDDITDSIRYILLDDSSLESLAGNVFGAMMDDGKLFVGNNPSSDREAQQIISVYDLNGRFLNKIGMRGRARNEFLYINSWYLDIERNHVLILDNGSQSIKRYSYDGTYISQIPLPDDIHANRIFMNGGRLYVQSLTPNDITDDLIELNDDGTFTNLFSHRDIITENFFLEGISRQPATGLTQFYYLRLFDNTLYKVTGSKVDSCGLFNFFNVPSAQKLRNLTTDDDGLLMQMHSMTAPETTNYIIINKWSGPIYVYNKLTGKCTCYQFNATQLPYQSRIIGASGNTIITRLTSFYAQNALENHSDIISDSDKQMLQAIASSENDALILYHLK